MRKLVVSVVTLAMCSVASQAALTELETFDNLNDGTINLQHVINEYGFDVELWTSQANKQERGDNNYSNVLATGGNDNSKCLELINRDADDTIDTTYTTLYLGFDNQITDKGTVYLQYKADGPNDTILAFNDNLNGFGTNVVGDPILDGFQGTTNYGEQGPLCRLSGDEDFRARHDGSYINVDMGVAANTWNEIWVQFDVSNKQTRYYVCEAGGTPAVVINPNTSGEWFGWRDDTNANIQNLKFFVGMYPWPAADTQTTVLIDTIAVSKDWDLDSFWVTPEPSLPGDIDGDCDVDIFDFLILKANYGTSTGATLAMGDLDGDGDVDIFDFLILKANYGSTCE